MFTKTNLVEEVTLSTLKDILQEIASVKDIKLDGDALTFKYKDKDGDSVLAAITLDGDERILCSLLLKMPENYFVTSAICANMYNTRKDAHGTFAYVTPSDDEFYITLETHILTRGGISKASIKHDLRNFIDHIDKFEEIMISAINKLGPDSSFLKSSGWAAFWEGAGAFFSGYMQAY